MSRPRPSHRRVQNVWMFSYEYSGVAQAGGLGEAVSGLAKTLSSDYDRSVTVFLPSHGRHLDPKIVRQFGLDEEPTFAASGSRIGVNTVRYKYLSGLETGKDQRVNLALVKGLDDPTSYWLDNPDLYDHELTFEKMALFARTVTTYSEYVLSMKKRSEIPDLIHVNDWHMVPAGVAVKQHFLERGAIVPLIFTVHLLSRITLPWHYASADWAGIKNLRHKARVGKSSRESLTYREVWEDYAGDSIEKFGSIESDYVTSVSESYLNRDVRDYVGDIIQGKSGHIHNGCDWDYDQIKSFVLSREVDTQHTSNASQVQRWDLRRSLLVKDLATLDQTPSTTDFDLDQEKTDKIPQTFSFEDDGPLVLMTGRLSPQKGADLLLDAVPAVKKIIPATKFLLFLLPSNDSSLTEDIAAKASEHPENVRLFFGRVPSLYTLAHIAADVYAMPSRSEPFGISALEAMVTGNPVVGSNLGGISETVLDLASHGEKGTGILVHPEDSEEIARSLISLLLVMQIDELHQRGGGADVSLANKIPIEEVSELVSEDPALGSKIRGNCRARVEQTFRWRNAGKIALERYATAQGLA